MNLDNNKKLNKNKAFGITDVFMLIILVGAIVASILPKFISMDDESQIKAHLQEAYTYIANKGAVLDAAKESTPTSSKEDIVNFFTALNMELPIDGFASSEQYPVESSNKLKDSDKKGGLQWGEALEGEDEDENLFGDIDDLLIEKNPPKEDAWSPWLVTNNKAYSFMIPKDRVCANMSVINNQHTDTKGAIKNSCFLIVVDVNGLDKGSNRLEPQQISGINTTDKLNRLSGDRFYIYVGKDGIATGSSDLTITGRIVIRSEVNLN